MEMIYFIIIINKYISFFLTTWHYCSKKKKGVKQKWKRWEIVCHFHFWLMWPWGTVKLYWPFRNISQTDWSTCEIYQYGILSSWINDGIVQVNAFAFQGYFNFSALVSVDTFTGNRSLITLLKTLASRLKNGPSSIAAWTETLSVTSYERWKS